MIHAWLDLPLGGIIAVLAAIYSATAVFLVWLTFHSPLRQGVQRFTGLVPAYFGCIAILFALLTGFLAAEISERNRHAARIVQAEAEALTSLYTLSIASAPDMSAIRSQVRAYARSVLDDEWPTIVRGEGATKTAALLAELMQSVAQPKIATDAGPAVHGALVNLSLRIAGARSDRLSIGADRSYDLKWLTVLFLCLMTQVALALVHLDRKRPQCAALAIFSIAAVIALGLIAEQESPFDGALQVSRAPLEHVLRLPPAPNNPNG